LDLHRLEAGDVLGSEVRSSLAVAAFLDGFDIADSAEFTHWKDRQQARLLPLIKDALVVLIDRCRRTGDSREIERLADRMLALDELSEEAIRAKMEARAFAGDRLTALEFYEEWRAKLAEELQAVPSDLVEGIAVRLRRRGWERTTLTNIPTVPTDQWRGRPFIGRATEYRVLYEAWEAVRRGQPGHALVLGDSGVGKTTLVEKLTTAAGLEGAAISRVQCYDLEREIPYSTVSNLILGLLDRPGVSATSPQVLAELSRTVPAVRHRFPTIPTANESQGESARIRLTEAFHDLLATIAEEHPVILVVDDLHYADDVSLAVLHLMMRRARQQSIMVLLLARPGELSQSPQAERLRSAALTLGIQEMEVPPLTKGESLELLQSLIPADQRGPGVTIQRALLRAGAGYPMVIELLVREWQVSGERSLGLSVDAMTTDLGGPAPAVYGDILGRITRSLDPITYMVLNFASLLGRRLNDPDMFGLVDLSVGQTVSGMAELVRRKVLRDGARGLEFVNDMVRAAAYVGVPATLRRVLHSKIADRLMHEHERSTEDLGLEIAWHCMRADRTYEATPHLLRGAREAIRSGLPYGAERGLSTALPHLSGRDRSGALVLLSEALQEQGRWEESLVLLDQVSVDVQSSSTDLAFVLRTKARRRLGLIAFDDLEDLPRSLLRFIESPAEIGSRIKAAVEVASVLNASRSRVLPPSLVVRLSELLGNSLDAEDMTRLLLAKSMLYYNAKDFESSLGCIHDAMELLSKRDSPNTVLAMLQNGLGAIWAAQGNYKASLTAFDQSHETAFRIGGDKIYLQAAANSSLCLARLGEYERAVECAERVLAQNKSDIWMHYWFQAAQSAVSANAMLGRAARAEELIQETADQISAARSVGLGQAWALYSADGYMMLGKTLEAERKALWATTGNNTQLHMEFCVGSYARWLARTAMPLTKGGTDYVHQRLESLCLHLEQYDALDQAEILNARCWLYSRTLGVSSELAGQMNKHLDGLPVSIREQLKRMGMLDWVGEGLGVHAEVGLTPSFA
jgi:tetratricopeptide (TPR) repeat protein/type II secretory pathway predicted ATPase ExeA